MSARTRMKRLLAAAACARPLRGHERLAYRVPPIRRSTTGTEVAMRCRHLRDSERHASVEDHARAQERRRPRWRGAGRSPTASTRATPAASRRTKVRMSNCDDCEPRQRALVAAKALCRPAACLDTHPTRDARPRGFPRGQGTHAQWISATTQHRCRPRCIRLISHGATGLGAWTIAAYPAGRCPKATRTRATRQANTAIPLRIKRMPCIRIRGDQTRSTSTILLVYATITDLASAPVSAARNWPDDVDSGRDFQQDQRSKLRLAKLHPVRVTRARRQIQYMRVNGQRRVRLDSASNPRTSPPQNIPARTRGLGEVVSARASGVADLSSCRAGPDELLRLDIGADVRRFAVALDGFGFEESQGRQTATWKRAGCS